MTTLYIDHHGAQLGVEGGLLIVKYPESAGKDRLALPSAQVDRVVILADVHFTAAAIKLLLKRGIPALFSRYGNWQGVLDRCRSGNPQRRAAQYHWLRDEEAAMKVAKALIAAKVANQHHVLRGWHLPHVGDVSQDLAAVLQVNGREGLRGVEGSRARDYFAGLAEHVGGHGWNFPGRRHHPATDPVNALLSFGYTLLTQEMALAVSAHGLEGDVGPLHVSDGRQPALVLDLIEPFRPLLDRLVVQTLIHRLKPGDFRDTEKGYRLENGARDEFITAWEAWLTEEIVWQGRSHSRHQLIDLQVEMLCRHLDSDEPPRFYHVGDH